ncbi:MAG: ferrous iron transport protein A [Bacillota bacterium]|nr:ferrous iron transport protein A [Bacillota bacterium]
MAPPLSCLSGFPSVADLAVGEEARVVEINYKDPRQLRKLLAVGILPGTKIALIQRYPVYVLQVGWTKIALDQHLARAVWVSRNDEENT